MNAEDILARFVADMDELRRLFWRELLREKQQNPDLDITAEFSRDCACFDAMIAVGKAMVGDENAQFARAMQQLDDAHAGAMAALDAIARGDFEEAMRLAAENRSRFLT